MRGTQPRLRHLVGAATLTGSLLFAALTFASLPAGAQTTTAAVATASCPVLSVGNPSAGNTIQQGDYVVSGEAWDPAASSGSGIARVDMFLGPRDEGGTFLASAVPGLGNNPRAYSVTVNIPTVNEGNTFAAYAISAVTGQETAVLVPIFIGTPTRSVGATPTPLPTTETVISTCPGGAAAATPAAAGMPMASTGASSGGASTASTPVPAAPAAGGSTTAATTGANSCPVLTLGNPNPGDVVAAGDLVISGGAYVAGANPAPGVSRVDLFLGPRDQGGTFLGSGTPGYRAGRANVLERDSHHPRLGSRLELRGVRYRRQRTGVQHHLPDLRRHRAATQRRWRHTNTDSAERDDRFNLRPLAVRSQLAIWIRDPPVSDDWWIASMIAWTRSPCSNVATFWSA